MGRIKELAMANSAWASRAFDGSTYEPSRDFDRLTGQLGAVYDLMRDGQWRTLKEIHEKVGGTEAAISSRLRDLRKRQYGSHIVDRRHIEHGLFEYRLQTRSAA